MNNKKYIRILAEVAIVLSAAGMITGCVNKKTEDASSSQADIAITTDNETTADETTKNEIIADSSSNIESSSSLNESSESSKNESSESSKIESESKSESSSNAESSEIEDVNCINFLPKNNSADNINNENVAIVTAPITTTSVSVPIRDDDTSRELGEAITDNETDYVSQEVSYTTSGDYEPYELYNMGRLYWGDYQYTWYSERVLPGYGLAIDGRHTDADGFVCDGDGYICVAASSLNKGTIVDTPFGRQGKVYDAGCDWGVIDVYVNW